MQEVLYRFFDFRGTLLYVGISRDWISRLRQHEKSADFYSAVAGMTIERFPDRATVEAAEKEAIDKENPLFNRASNPNYRTWQTHFREIVDMSVGAKHPDEVHQSLIEALTATSGWVPNFGTGKWMAEHFAAEWHLLTAKGKLRCDLCDVIANHQTLHAWAESEEEK
jgi:predicted GIY-YIG superfamily endonuclease